MTEATFKVLIIDDDEVDRMRLKRFLADSVELRPLTIDEAADGAAGLDAVMSQTYDCVLLDYNLPGANALNILQELNDCDAILPPVIVQTVMNDHEAGIRTVEAGAQDYLVKGSFDGTWLTRSILYARERHRLLQEQILLVEKLRQMATIDELTGTYNRRHFESELQRRLSEARRYKHPFSLLLADVDNFKAINDSQGHQQGDAVLKAVAHTLKSRLRTTDILARYGGDEFAVILLGAERAVAMRVAEELRDVVEQEWADARMSAQLAPTLSIGVAVFPADGDDKNTLVARADERLYVAKRAGRNRVHGGDIN